MEKIQIGSCNEAMLNRVCGYINLKVLCDEDYLFVSGKLKKIITKFSGTRNPTDDFSWLYYLADFLLLEYYFNKYCDAKKLMRKDKAVNSDPNKEYFNQLKQKYTYFYCRIVEDHKEYYDIMVERYYKPVYQVTELIHEDNDIFYDFITINRELIMYEFVSINNDIGKVYEKLAFCYKSFIPGWDSRRLVELKRKKTLSRMLIDFVNEYSRISGLPQVVLLFYFYPMEEEIYNTGVEKTKLNSYFSRIDINAFLKLERHKHVDFINNVYDKRMNNIDKWCCRLKERIIREMIDRMDILTLFERS